MEFEPGDDAGLVEVVITVESADLLGEGEVVEAHGALQLLVWNAEDVTYNI